MAQSIAVKGTLSIKGLPRDWYFPTTRYRGSKRKVLPWIWESIRDLDFETALDLFGGTGIVSLLLKRMGKLITYNDYLTYNHLAGVALVENNKTLLTEDDLDFLLQTRAARQEGFIARTFRGYYFPDDENAWLDKVLTNVDALSRIYSGITLRQKRALAIWALGQACLIKRPFNLFHRRNLSLRTKRVARSFGNKTTWETPFPIAFQRFVRQANQTIFASGREHKAICADAFSLRQTGHDLVYIDPPYFFENQRDTDYRELYHFLEGMSRYKHWHGLIDYSSFNLRLKTHSAVQWSSQPQELVQLYSILIKRFKRSTIVISHKSGSLVPVGTLTHLLLRNGKRVRCRWKRYRYALSKQNGKPRYNIEWLLIGV